VENQGRQRGRPTDPGSSLSLIICDRDPADSTFLVQIGSHYPFLETNGSLRFDRILAFQQTLRLDIPAGTAVRFEPGESKSVVLTQFGGKQLVQGGSGIATAVREQGLDVESPEAATLVRYLLEKGRFAIGDEGLAEVISNSKEMEREAVS